MTHVPCVSRVTLHLELHERAQGASLSSWCFDDVVGVSMLEFVIFS